MALAPRVLVDTLRVLVREDPLVPALVVLQALVRALAAVVVALAVLVQARAVPEGCLVARAHRVLADPLEVRAVVPHRADAGGLNSVAVKEGAAEILKS